MSDSYRVNWSHWLMSSHELAWLVLHLTCVRTPVRRQRHHAPHGNALLQQAHALSLARRTMSLPLVAMIQPGLATAMGPPLTARVLKVTHVLDAIAKQRSMRPE